MSKPRQSLNRMVPWNQLLDLLGAKIHAMGLPTRCRCPLCHEGVLRIDEDPVVGGQWFSCQRCGTQGDMIELAAAVWNLDIPATVVRLARHGLMLPIEPKAISRYEQQHVQYRQRLNRLWKDAQAGQVFRSHTLQRLLDRLGLHAEGTEQAWNKGPGCLIGGIDKVSVESCFAPRGMQHAQARRQHVNPSARAVFRGGDWSDVLMLPLYDLPGRICAFLCIGREADPDGDFVLKCANFGSAANQHCSPPVEAGLAVHPDVLIHAETWDNTIVAVNDLVTALRLQVRHLRNSLHPLPLAVWIDTVTGPVTQTSGRRARTRHAWRMLGNRKIVFWMPAFDLATIRQAVQADGLISIVGPREESEQALKEYCWKTVPCDLFKQIQKHAKPWPEVLSSALSSMRAIDIEEILLRLEDEGDDVESILRRCGGDVRNRVAEIQSAIDLPRRVTLNRRTILETKEGWYVVSKRSEQRELISDAILRIDFAVPHLRLGTVYYQGRVLYKGEEVPFLERKDRVEKETLNWMQGLLYQREVGVMMFNPDWTRRIVTIAGRFQETKLLEGVDTIGWNNERLCFVLPGYSIRQGGDVKPNEVAIFPEDAPGRQLEEPIVLSGEELDRPAADDALAGLFWGTVACVLSNILAPAFNRQPCGISLEGEGAINVGMTVAESLGCSMHRLGDAKQVRRALEDEGTHQWPMVFRPTAMVQRRYRRQLVEGAGDDRNCIMAVSWETGRVLGIKGGWHFITSDRRNVKVGPEVHDLARKLIPSYLRNLCARQLQLDGWQDPKQTFVDRVLNDLARFVEEHHADPQPVLAASDVLLPERDAGRAKAFADLVGHFVKTGRLKIAAEGDWRGKPTLVESATDGGLYLSQQVLVKLLKDQPVEPPAIDVVATVLAAEGVLVEARDGGWVFDADWFRTRQRLEAGLSLLHG